MADAQVGRLHMTYTSCCLRAARMTVAPWGLLYILGYADESHPGGSLGRALLLTEQAVLTSALEQAGSHGHRGPPPGQGAAQGRDTCLLSAFPAGSRLLVSCFLLLFLLHLCSARSWGFCDKADCPRAAVCRVRRGNPGLSSVASSPPSLLLMSLTCSFWWEQPVCGMWGLGQSTAVKSVYRRCPLG